MDPHKWRMIWCWIVLSIPSVLCQGRFYTVHYNATTSSYTLTQEIDKNGVSWASYDDSSINETGWATASIGTSNQYTDEIQYTAAGYLEGSITQPLIYSLQSMFFALYPNTSTINKQVTQWFEEHIAWLQAQVVANYKQEKDQKSPPDPFWESVNLMLCQLKGLVAGYNEYAPAGQGLSYTQLFMLNSGGDLMDVVMSLDPSTRSELFFDHCSALILPVVSDAKLVDLFTGHTTWNQYNSMLRIFKHYIFNYTVLSPTTNFHFLKPDSRSTSTSASSSPSRFSNLPPTSFHQAFSSYPAFLFSGDDYYETSKGLAVIETTFTIFNNQLYKFVQPDGGVLTWMRAAVANRLASSGSEWAELFSNFNSGTYNNQWMVVDYKLINSTLQDNLLWVVEQIPGNIQSADMTATLRTQGYWPSYNIPFFEKIYNLSGYADMATQYGAQYVYNTSARANIFRRDTVKISTIEEMRSLMQYNDWRNDPLSLGNPSYSISSRFDLLNGTNAQLTGGIDSKVTSVGMFSQGLTYAISGPTHQQQPAFSWAPPWNSSPHFGQPSTFDFGWVLL